MIGRQAVPFSTEKLELLRCPRTKSTLALQPDGQLRAQEGGHLYPVVEGIPDFRLFDPPYTTRDEERKVVGQLFRAAASMGHEELIRLLENNVAPHPVAERRAKAVAHRLALRERAPRRLDDLFDKAGGMRIPGGRALDLGCGSGEAVGALIARGATEVVGVDISLVELALARKLLDESGIDALLVAGCAEALPFADEAFRFVYSPDVIEHVADQPAYLQEAHRVLEPEGSLLLNSPNRYSVVCPEPHVGIWALTFLPRPLIDPVCRLLGRGPYVGKRLVSLPELRKLVGAAFGHASISARRSNPTAESLFGRLYHATSPLSERAFAYVADQHVVLASRAERKSPEAP
jgi:SAM-dependent methyltransferase/uncharacterized protein YbaR (Trm112 family)